MPKEYAARFPTGTPMEVYTPVNAPPSVALPNSIAFVLDGPKSDTVFPVCQVRSNITITKITATIKGGSAYSFNIESRSSVGLNASGTPVLTWTLTADQDGESSTNIANAAIPAGNFLVLVASDITGSVDQIVVEIDYTSTIMTDNFVLLDQFNSIKKRVVLTMG